MDDFKIFRKPLRTEEANKFFIHNYIIYPPFSTQDSSYHMLLTKWLRPYVMYLYCDMTE
jgi:hypothetical protein